MNPYNPGIDFDQKCLLQSGDEPPTVRGILANIPNDIFPLPPIVIRPKVLNMCYPVQLETSFVFCITIHSYNAAYKNKLMCLSYIDS